MKRIRITLILLGVAILLSSLPAHADLVTYDFEVTATSGPLSGTTADGTFTYDTAIQPAGGGQVTGVGLITSLSFTWNSTPYDAYTANTGYLTFAPDGTLANALFGTNNGAGNGKAVPGTNGWEFYYGGTGEGGASAFAYTIAGVGDVDVYAGSASASQDSSAAVPEPSSLLLLGSALAGIGVWGPKKFKCI